MKNRKMYWFLIISPQLLIWFGWAVIFQVLHRAADLSWALLVSIFFLALVLLSLYILLEEQKSRIILVIALATLPAIGTVGQYWYVMIPAWVLCNLIMALGVDRIRSEKENRIRIIPHSLVRFGFPIITTAMALLISTVYYLAIKDRAQTGKLPDFKVEVPSQITEAGIGMASVVVPEVGLRSMADGATVDEFIKGTLSQSLSVESDDVEQYLGAQGATLSEDQKAQLQSQVEQFSSANESLAMVEARNQMSKQLGINLTGNEKMSQVMSDYVNKRISSFFNGEREGENILPLGMALALFLMIKSIAWLLSYPFAWTTTGVFHIMIWLGGLKVQKNSQRSRGD